MLNSELPQKSRGHVVDEFNRGVYDTIIATDESRKSMKKSKKTKVRIGCGSILWVNQDGCGRGVGFFFSCED